jgi:hypothetical protein
MPGNQFAAVDVVCAPCEAAGRYRRLARFGRYTYPGASRQPWVEGWQTGGQRVTPAWTPAPGGSETVQLACPEGHHKPVRMERVIAGFDAMPPPDPGGRRVVRLRL